MEENYSVLEHCKGNVATQYGQSTLCSESVSKSTQAEICTRKVSVCAHTDELEHYDEPSPLPKVPLPSKAPPVALRNSRGSCYAVQKDSKLDVTEGDCRLGLHTSTTCSEERESSVTANFRGHGRLILPRAGVPLARAVPVWSVLETVQDHLISHIDRTTAKCPLCESVFNGKYWALMRHVQGQHMPTRPFMCNICGIMSITKQDACKHGRLCRARTQVVDRYLGSSGKCQ
ncbi:hypothetical protein HPB50_005940 [Hyalomma asiaticum]|uniref:Uncharacterized protein n=1 Tax=Hyalomma asiaticum TaxID=266040 RepID=A0ACB7RM74_HYAAI|nr:hypothetical protein HPB50_005940 [Hyalomma asiaticum]